MLNENPKEMKNNNVLISVVIAIYNVESFLHRCLDSIIKQTYKNIEMILVDDGSTDNSGKICDEYILKDSRINVIHKKNGGLSSARNTGIDFSNGNYITFVDGDDWLREDFIEKLSDFIYLSDVDIISSRLIIAYKKDNEYIYNEPRKYKAKYLTNEEALEALFYRKLITTTACGKIYKKSLFNTIRFPENKLHEDLGTVYKLLEISKKVISVESTGYCYFQRNGSIMNSDFNKKNLDALNFVNEIILFVEKKYPKLRKAVKSFFVDINIEYYLKLIKTKNNKNDYLRKEFLKNILINSKDVLLNLKSRNKLKLKIIYVILSEFLFRIYLVL